jgi:YcxB-like protein
MDSSIHLLFRYSERDFVQAMRTHFAARLRLKLDLAVAAGAALLGLYVWQSLNLPLYGIPLLGLSVLLVLLLVVAFGLIPGLVFRREPKFRDEYSLTFSPDGIHFRTVHIDSRLNWSMYNRALVDADSFILYYGSRSFTVIPKRVFENAEQLATFERLISQKIPEVSKNDS